MLRIGHRGFIELRWFGEGWCVTIARAYSLLLQRFRDFCEGCEGFARAYTCEREGGALRRLRQ
jgi:hypothetical protein